MFLHDHTHPQEHSGHDGFGQLRHDPLLQQPPLSQHDDWHLKHDGCPLQHDDWQLKHCAHEHFGSLKQPPVHRGQEQHWHCSPQQLQLGLQSPQQPPAEQEPHSGLHSPQGLQPPLQHCGLLQLQHPKQPQLGLQHEGILKQLQQFGLQHEQFGSQHEQSKQLGLLQVGRHWQEQHSHEAHTHSFDLQENNIPPSLVPLLLPEVQRHKAVGFSFQYCYQKDGIG
ncbi:hypothetical protein ZWY2020_038912 [Hordeum vulgare]|nr:hypothetical protein ZWY2020_038912 [Hordeum vulgare]